jgi:hypothetical protein
MDNREQFARQKTGFKPVFFLSNGWNFSGQVFPIIGKNRTEPARPGLAPPNTNNLDIRYH